MAQFWDSLYYLLVYTFGFDLFIAERIKFFFVVFISLFVSYIGFEKCRNINGNRITNVSVFLVTIWYCFNPYTLELYHGGVYNIGLCITYSLAPLIFYYFYSAIYLDNSLSNTLRLAILISFASYTFWLFAGLLVFIILFFFFQLIFAKKDIKLKTSQAIILIFSYLLLSSFTIFSILFEKFNNFGNNNSNFLPTFGNIQGGLLYQIKMYFSWAIYTQWNPRSLYPFHEYFFSNIYYIAIILLYAIILFGLIFCLFINNNFKISYLCKIFRNDVDKSGRLNILLYSIFSILLICIFMAKGPQPPFGNFFLFLYNHVPLFSVFRTPDIRFGFPIVLSISLLLLYISQYYKSCLFVIANLFFITTLSWPFFNGSAVKGENISNLYYDRITNFSSHQLELAEYINSKADTNGYILPIPAIDYGIYRISEGDFLVGQDLVSKLVKTPFVYLSKSGGISSAAFEKLDSIINTGNFKELNKFPIKYVLFRTDICDECFKPENQISSVADLVFKNEIYRLYKLRNSAGIIQSKNSSNLEYDPLKFIVSFDHVSQEQPLNLLLSFDKNWKIFILNDKYFFGNKLSGHKSTLHKFPLLDLSFPPFRDGALNLSHKSVYDWANSWTISPKDICNNSPSSCINNSDNSYNFSLLIIYMPQIWFSIFWLISFSSFIAIVFFLFIKSRLFNTRALRANV